ncbi:type II secretion system protein M [Brenneria izadpanahii]|uniref:Type II secretion system protein M n=1 Tax=Brenneria izadpanahii TaxID=2722756 RepID=A0ABX7UYK4_9GAMM|nr:type II secretion system protein GspM [Brenneria izadpanahii]QTF08718.1 type II secretion system protein M [Brenneria izadpanahii]
MSGWTNLLVSRRRNGRIAVPGGVRRLLQKMGARVRPVLVQTRGRWLALNRRERRQIVLTAAALVAAVVWLLLVKPALDTLAYWDRELPRLHSQAAALQEVLADVGVAAGAPTSSLPPVARLTASLDNAGLAGHNRIEMSGDALLLAFESPTDAARLMSWLLNAPASLGMSVQHAILSRPPEENELPASDRPVRVHATVTVAVQSSAGREP